MTEFLRQFRSENTKHPVILSSGGMEGPAPRYMSTCPISPTCRPTFDTLSLDACPGGGAEATGPETRHPPGSMPRPVAGDRAQPGSMILPGTSVKDRGAARFSRGTDQREIRGPGRQWTPLRGREHALPDQTVRRPHPPVPGEATRAALFLPGRGGLAGRAAGRLRPRSPPGAARGGAAGLRPRMRGAARLGDVPGGLGRGLAGGDARSRRGRSSPSWPTRPASGPCSPAGSSG